MIAWLFYQENIVHAGGWKKMTNQHFLKDLLFCAICLPHISAKCQPVSRHLYMHIYVSIYTHIHIYITNTVRSCLDLKMVTCFLQIFILLGSYCMPRPKSQLIRVLRLCARSFRVCVARSIHFFFINTQTYKIGFCWLFQSQY